MPHHVHRQELLVPRQRGKCIVIDCYKRLPSSRSIKLFQNCIWRLRAPCKEGSFSTTHSHWHAVCKTITMRRCLIFVPTLVLCKCEYNSLASHEGNHGFYREMSVKSKWNAYSLHMSKNCNKQLLSPLKLCSSSESELLECCGCIRSCSDLNAECLLSVLKHTFGLVWERIKKANLINSIAWTAGYKVFSGSLWGSGNLRLCLMKTKHCCAWNWFNFTHFQYAYEKISSYKRAVFSHEVYLIVHRI